MTHAQLAEIARRWLLRAESAKGPGCNLALKEVGALWESERADTWGCRWGHNACSVVVEVKVSRADFLRDRHKPHRQTGGMGDFRYYLCPEGVIQLADVPERWGLLWVNRRGHVRVLSGHVTSSFAVLAWDTVEATWVMRHALRDYVHFWRNDCDVVVERSMLTNLLLRLGDDPDALLQQLREQRRLNNQRSDEIERLKKQARDVDFRHYAMYRALVDNGLAHLIPPEKQTELPVMPGGKKEMSHD